MRVKVLQKKYIGNHRQSLLCTVVVSGVGDTLYTPVSNNWHVLQQPSSSLCLPTYYKRSASTDGQNAEESVTFPKQNPEISDVTSYRINVT